MYERMQQMDEFARAKAMLRVMAGVYNGLEHQIWTNGGLSRMIVHEVAKMAEEGTL